MEKELYNNSLELESATQYSQDISSLTLKNNSSIRTTVDYQNIKALSVLGKGAQGQVVLCRSQNQREQKHFVAKIFSHTEYIKEQNLNQQHLQNIQNEFQIMEKLRLERQANKQIIKGLLAKKQSQKTRRSSNEDVVIQNQADKFLIKPLFQIKGDTHSLMALELCPGGELFSLMKAKGSLSVEEAKFYTANVIIGLERLHQQLIIYKDLKPENILIDAQGYCKLTDFGLSQIDLRSTSQISLSEPQSGIQQSQGTQILKISENKKQAIQLDDVDFGTPEYMPPEYYKSNVYDYAGDWWALGCLIYEVVTGSPPFFNLDMKRLASRIIYTDPDYKKIDDENLKDLIKKLLSKDPLQRIEYSKNIKNHQWFCDLNWKKVLDKTMAAPYVPSVSKQGDLVTNIDHQSQSLVDLQNFNKDSLAKSIEESQGILDSLVQIKLAQSQKMRNQIEEAMRSDGTMEAEDYDYMEQDLISNSSFITNRSNNRSVSPSSKRGSKASQLFII
ncbi:ph-protein kinase domain containing protein [Stylonychia lemnae]|uniref:non-specific serine/threonine protein kinase n=1 Tax=Stylonychia lemnae TaxID=5949 RepID=A0A078AAG1_STYLE|nr:ph-protein kinase domain containing protein [Stylonychia lemnae]|eukprot:CDW79255.1 ph-protein kinase domain containing protein [Stylonychia lemnae]